MFDYEVIVKFFISVEFWLLKLIIFLFFVLLDV